MSSSPTTPAPPDDHATRVAGVFAAEPIGAALGRVRLGQRTISEEVAAAVARAERHGKPSGERYAEVPAVASECDPAWLDRFDRERLAEGVAGAASVGLHAPLAGVPVAVKGNIDVAGLPTTAACPGFAQHDAERHATAVQRLADAGAVILGTTNLDQFATGLNGTRSPYGAPHAVGLPGRISGGSSSGSAVAVARGDVPLALGTDTAGSGRVPAALNGIVGLKPSKGLVSAAGVLPACRSLDVVSVFAADVDSAALALTVLAGADARDPWSRRADGFFGAILEEVSALAAGASAVDDEGDSPTIPLPPPRAFVAGGAANGGTDSPTLPLPPPLELPLPPAAASPDQSGRPLRLAIPHELPTEGVDPAAIAAWELALTHTRALAHEVELVPIDMAAFYEAGALLYGGAFVAERYASVGAFIERSYSIDPSDPSLDPTVRDIVLAGAAPSAAEAFADQDRVRRLTAHAHRVLAQVDALLTPTVLEHPTHADLAADPIGANARLGRFTTFGNLLDLAVLALPGAPRADGLPFGVSFHAPAFYEARVLELGARFERAVREASPSGSPTTTPASGSATNDAQGGAATLPPAATADGRVLLAVGGAHMSGMPLTHELLGEGGEYVRLTRTAPDYRLHVLDTPLGPRPGIEHVASPAPDSLGVEVEVWSLPADRLGAFIHRVPPALALGPITLFDGSAILGFLGAASDTVAPARTVPTWRHFARGD